MIQVSTYRHPVFCETLTGTRPMTTSTTRSRS